MPVVVKRNKLAFILIPVVIVIISVLSSYRIYKYYNDSIYKPLSNLNNAKSIQMTINNGLSNDGIADMLYNAGLIKNKITFKIYLKSSKLGNTIKAGKYEFNTAMSPAQIVNKMSRGEVKKDTVRITIPEGYIVKDIASIVEKAGFCDKNKFLEAVNNGDYQNDYVFLKNLPKRSGVLEGYLFPDTYEFYKDATPDKIIRKMLDRFDQVFTEQMRTKASSMNLSIDQVVTLASIVEKEAKVSSERSVIAGVYYNRLKDKMLLQADATVLYALGEWKDRVLFKDLEVNSPYNTYKFQGLPIGPISNPGKASIEAALNPSDVNYLFYVLKNDGSNSHAFTTTYDDFLKELQKNKSNQK